MKKTHTWIPTPGATAVIIAELRKPDIAPIPLHNAITSPAKFVVSSRWLTLDPENTGPFSITPKVNIKTASSALHIIYPAKTLHAAAGTIPSI